MDRYQLYIVDKEGKSSAIRVYDRLRSRILMMWQGEVARRLIDSSLLVAGPDCGSCQRCDKNLVRRLALAAASIATDIDHKNGADRLLRRLQRLNRDVSPFHAEIAGMLFAYQHRHFAHEEIVCLVTLHNPSICRQRIEDHIDELVQWNVIQRIAVDAGRVFYDINTEPHLHVYCPRKQELHDAPTDGVLRLPGAANNQLALI